MSGRGIGGCEPANRSPAPFGRGRVAHDEYPVRHGVSIQSRLSLDYWITRSGAQLRTRRVMTTACVAEWHSKFHAMARGIEATPMKK
jgi:hypothetical protein